MNKTQSKASLKTRSAAECSTTSSAQRMKGQVSQLKALQAQRSAEDAERTSEIRGKAAAEDGAQIVLQEARADEESC